MLAPRPAVAEPGAVGLTGRVAREKAAATKAVVLRIELIPKSVLGGVQRGSNPSDGVWGPALSLPKGVPLLLF
ncbi:MAG: hypothetical protein AAB270_08965, partial [Chloroflexota bacterium]